MIYKCRWISQALMLGVVFLVSSCTAPSLPPLYPAPKISGTGSHSREILQSAPASRMVQQEHSTQKDTSVATSQPPAIESGAAGSPTTAEQVVRIPDEEAVQPIGHSTIPPSLARLEETKKNPFLTRSHMARLITSLPGIPFGHSREMTIMTDIIDLPDQESIIMVVQSGYMDAFPNHRFKPEAFISRAEMAEFMSRMLDTTIGSGSEHVYDVTIPDLPLTNRYSYPVKRAIALGLMRVGSNGKFSPAEPVTGSEAWEIFLRFCDLISGISG